MDLDGAVGKGDLHIKSNTRPLPRMPSRKKTATLMTISQVGERPHPRAALKPPGGEVLRT